MAVSKKQQACVARYNSKNYEELKIRVKKGEKELLKKHAELKDGGSLNGFVTRAIKETIERDMKNTEPR